jgi:hypothetical protein
VALAAIYAENTTLEEGRLTKAVFSTHAMVIAAFVPRRPAICARLRPLGQPSRCDLAAVMGNRACTRPCGRNLGV